MLSLLLVTIILIMINFNKSGKLAHKFLYVFVFIVILFLVELKLSSIYSQSENISVYNIPEFGFSKGVMEFSETLKAFFGQTFVTFKTNRNQIVYDREKHKLSFQMQLTGDKEMWLM